jgi:hypothetical protein
MLWQEIRQKYPSKWLVIEAKKFHQADDFLFANTEMPILEIPTSRWMRVRVI